ncbi:replication-relaxation family protein [Kitasatospora herbaricolor]|uniref:Replication-relaxation family protein n=1 Tax=Kitasatospora herbaricolor TaxID=68217 RepID=A0ABZ1VZL1_9ACTN|nr:replication-relaxation family protein [Kitasatospora herbaricolor]
MTNPTRDATPEPTAKKKRVNFPASAAYPHRSTAPLRSKVLAVLGVLKVASTNQVWKLAVPHHKRPGKAYEAPRDLVENKLVEQRGTTTARPGALPRPPGAKRAGDGETIWGLTDLGLAAAATVLPDHWHRGSRAREAGRATGSPHAMDVNETILAFTNGGLAATSPIGTIGNWHTHLSHELPGGRRQIADAVLQAPDHDVPLLLVEVDRHHETPTELAAKFAGYWEFFHLAYKQRPRPGDSVDWRDDDRELLPVWRRQYPHASAGSLPPVALVLTGAGELGTDNLATKVRDLTEQYWQPDRYDPFDFTDSIPIVMTRLDELQTDGPQGRIWWRYGNDELQSLTDALAGREYTERTRARLQAQDDAAQAAKDRQADEKAEASHCPTCRRRPDEYEDHWDASDGTTDCSPCRDTKTAAEAAQALLDAEARERCVTCQTGLIENNLLAHDPEAIECWDCYNKRDFSTGQHLRRPEPAKKRLFFRS